MTSSVTFPTALGGDGKTYTDDADPDTGLDGLGYTTRFIPCLRQALAMAGYTAQYAAKIDAAAANADRAEKAKDYVEAYAGALKSNILDSYSNEATLDLNFSRGLYLVDIGTLTKTTDASNVTSVARSTPKWVGGANGLLREVPAGKVARVWHNGEPQGVLIEKNATNLLLRSESFSQTVWPRYGGGSIVVENEAGAGNPKDRAGDAVLFSTDGSSSNNRIQQTISDLTSGQEYVFSIWVRSKQEGAGGRFRLTLSGSDFFGEATEHWNRFYVTSTVIQTSAEVMVRERDSACDIQIWGAQLELGGAHTSYIPTTSSSVSRDRDEVSRIVAADVSATAGTIYYEFDLKSFSQDAATYLMSFDDGTSSNFLLVQYRNSGNLLRVSQSGGGLSMDVALSQTYNKMVVIYDNEFIEFILNGSLIGSTSRTFPSELSRISLSGLGSLFTVKQKSDYRLIYCPKVLSTSTAEELTAL